MKKLGFLNQESKFWLKYIIPFVDDAKMRGDDYVCIKAEMNWRVFKAVEKKLQELGFKVGSSKTNSDVISSVVLSWD